MKSNKEITIKRLDGSLYSPDDYFFESDRKAYYMHASLRGITTTFELELKLKPPLSFRNMDRLITSGWIDLEEGYDYTDDEGIDQTHLELRLNETFRAAMENRLAAISPLGYACPLSLEEQEARFTEQKPLTTLLNLLSEHRKSVYMPDADRALIERYRETNQAITRFFAYCRAGLTPELKREIEYYIPLMSDTGRSITGETPDRQSLDKLLDQMDGNPLLEQLDIEGLMLPGDETLNNMLATYQSLRTWLKDLQVRLNEYPLPKTWVQVGDTDLLVNCTDLDIRLVETGSLLWKKWYVEIKSRRPDGQLFDFKTFRYRPVNWRLEADKEENKEKVRKAIVWRVSRFQARVAKSGYRFLISSTSP